MGGFEKVAETKWGTKKVRIGPNSNTTISYKSLKTIATELPIRVAGTVIPFALGNIAGEVIEHVPIVDQYTSSSTNMLLGILAGAAGFAKSGLNLDNNMQVEGVTISPVKIGFKK